MIKCNEFSEKIALTAFTKFLRKNCDSKIPEFLHCEM